MLARSRIRLALAPIALAAAVALPGTVLAATVSDTYTIRGAEYYATSTQGRFGGTASGNTGDSATWQATVNHTPLTDTVYWTLWIEFRFYLIVACVLAGGLTERRVRVFGTVWLGAALTALALAVARLRTVRRS